MRILVGGECFFMQEAGGVSRIFREILPRFHLRADLYGLAMFVPLPPPAMQSIDGLVDRYRGIWLWEDRKPFRIRKYFNRNVLKWFNHWLFNRYVEDVYASTYYSISPKAMPSIAFVYDMIYERFPDSFDPVNRQNVLLKKKKCFERTDYLLCISQQTKDDLISYYNVPAGKCRVCYLGGSEFSGGACVLPKTVLNVVDVVYVGNWRTEYKNFVFMLKGLAVLSGGAAKRYVLHVVSRIKVSPAERDAHLRLFSGEIVYHKDADDTQLRERYCRSDVCVYPSLLEGFGIPVVEALSCGLPVACSDIPVFHEIGGDVVEYFDPKDVEACADAIARAVESRDMPEKIEARMKRAGMFTWDKCAEVFAEVIKDVADERSKPRGH